jgi:hypothetical protein
MKTHHYFHTFRNFTVTLIPTEKMFASFEADSCFVSLCASRDIMLRLSRRMVKTIFIISGVKINPEDLKAVDS